VRPVRIGVVGCGTISDVYLRNCRRFAALEAVACADLDPARASAKAAAHGLAAMTVDGLLADPTVDVVLNLTVPVAHAAVSAAALAAGKAVYSEKPLATSREDGRRLVATAAAAGLRLGGAPDTFLGPGLQLCRRLLDAGEIGRPVAATAFMLAHGPEDWHPDPAFLYQPGGGPLFDMGPYYLTALVSLLGPVHAVAGSARASFPERVVGSAPKRGERIAVETPTHIAAVLDFEAGPIATMVTSFDVWAAEVPRIEIYGAAGTLSLPDPNTFGGPVRIRRAGEDGWREVPLPADAAENRRGIGLADLAAALRAGDGRPHRASADLTFHVLDTMQAILEAAAGGRRIDLDSRCDRPAPLAPGTPAERAAGGEQRR